MIYIMFENDFNYKGFRYNKNVIYIVYKNEYDKLKKLTKIKKMDKMMIDYSNKGFK